MPPVAPEFRTPTAATAVLVMGRHRSAAYHLRRRRAALLPRLLAACFFCLAFSMVAAAPPARAEQQPLVRGPATLIARLKGSGGSDVGFSADGRLILTAGHRDVRQVRKEGKVVDLAWTGDVRLWDAGTLRPVSDVASLPNLNHAAFVAGGKYVLTIDRNELILWDASLSRARVRVSLQNLLHAAAVNRDGSRIAISAFPRADALDAWTLEIRDGATGNLVQTLPKWEQTDFLAFSPDGSQLLTIRPHEEHGHVVHVWDLRAGREAFEPFRVDFDFTPFVDSVPAAFSPDGARIVVVDAPFFGIYDAHTGKLLVRARARDDDPPDAQGCVTVRFTADGKGVAALGVITRLWDAGTGSPITAKGARIDRWASQVSPDGSRVLGPNGLWDLRTGQQVRSFGTRFGNALAISPDSKRAATADRDGGDTLIWDISE